MSHDRSPAAPFRPVAAGGAGIWRPSNVRWRMLAVLLSLTLVGTLLPASAGSAATDGAGRQEACPDGVPAGFGFRDDSVHAAAAACLAWYGLVRGFEDGTFGYDRRLSRAQAAALIHRAVETVTGTPLGAGAPAPFADVIDTFFEHEIAGLSALEPPVVRGFEDGTFRPGGPVSRGQYASMVLRTLEAVGGHTMLPSRSPTRFSDTVGSVHADAIGRLAAAGVVSGFLDGTFRPGAPVTRGQSATMLAGVLDGLVADGMVAPPDADPDPDTDPDPDVVSVSLTGVTSQVVAGDTLRFAVTVDVDRRDGDVEQVLQALQLVDADGDPLDDPNLVLDEVRLDPDDGFVQAPGTPTTSEHVVAPQTRAVSVEIDIVDTAPPGEYGVRIDVFDVTGTPADEVHLDQLLAEGSAPLDSDARQVTITEPEPDPGPGPDPDPDPGPPADPVPTPVPTGVTTSVAATSSFLYEGDDAVQHDVAPGAFEERRKAVVRGTVTDDTGDPLPGVEVSVHRHDEFGWTRTRADGEFDLAVNGGDQLTLNYRVDGHLPAQRDVQVPWQDVATAPQVALVPLDDEVTEIDLTDEVLQTHRGSVASDEDGDRQPTLLFPAGTDARAVLPDGRTQRLETLSIRATEYTVGDHGPERMPGELPAQIAYTWAASFTVDEALALEAVTVEFDEPVWLYLENFIGFPVGESVPTGYYDFELAAWVADDDGRVVEVLDVVDGRAVLDLTGDGVAADRAELDAHGIEDAELAEVAELYRPGETLWRVPIPHFTPWDCNWPFGPPEGATAPDALNDPTFARGPGWSSAGGTGGPSTAADGDEEPCKKEGSIIECLEQVLRDEVHLPGSERSLHYHSGRGSREPSVEIPLTGSTLPPELDTIHLEVTVGGQSHSWEFEPEADLQHTFTWDRHDVYGRQLTGPQPVTVRLGYEYPLVYYASRDDWDRSFGGFGTQEFTGLYRNATSVVSWQTHRAVFGGLDARTIGLGGWMLDVHHVYDPIGRTLYRGDGTERSVDSLPLAVTTIAGGGSDQPSGDPEPAADVRFGGGSDLEATPDGGYLLVRQASASTSEVHRVDADGNMRHYAEVPTGSNAAPKLARAPDGTVYVSSFNGWSVHAIDPGTREVRRVAGAPRGTGEELRSGMVATEARLGLVRDIAVAPDGTLHIAHDGSRISRVDAQGLLWFVAGTGDLGFSGDGDGALDARIAPLALAITADGSIWLRQNVSAPDALAEGYPNRSFHVVRRITPDGRIGSVAGHGTELEPGLPGAETRFNHVNQGFGLVAAPEGGVYFAAGQSAGMTERRLWHIDPTSRATLLAGDGRSSFTAQDHRATTALRATLPDMRALGVVANGTLLIVEPTRVHRVHVPADGYDVSGHWIASDDARELYAFDRQGRHERTIDTRTGATRWEFFYEDGLLHRAVDHAGTVVEVRHEDGVPTAISHRGTTTDLAVDDQGFLTRIGAIDYRSTVDGLLVERRDALDRGAVYAYDEDGRLHQATDPAGGTQTLEPEEILGGHRVVHTSAAGVATTYEVTYPSAGGRRTVTTLPGGAATVSEVDPSGVRTTTLADGTEDVLRFASDPRFGHAARYPAERTITSPDGHVLAHEMDREIELTDPSDLLTLRTSTETVTVDGATTTTMFDADTRTEVQTSPAGRTTTYGYDELGRQTSRTPRDAATTTYAYDDAGRLATVTVDDDGEVASTTYTYDGGSTRIASVTDPAGQVTSATYDPSGDLDEIVRADGGRIAFTHDAVGQLTALDGPGEGTHRFAYGDRGELITTTAPEGSVTDAYTYDEDGNLTAIDHGDDRIELAWDPTSGLLDQQTTSRGTATFGYDGAGRLLEATSADEVALSHTWDGPLLTEQAWSGPVSGAVTVDYDGRSRPIAVTVDGEPVSTSYDRDGLPVRVGALEVGWHGGHERPETLEIGVVEIDLFHDGRGLRTAQQVVAGGDLVFDQRLTRDPLGRISERVETIDGDEVAVTYAYDDAGRLVEVAHDGTIVETYGYDADGNRTSAERHGSQLDVEVDDRGRLASVEGTAVEHTDSGHVRSFGGGHPAIAELTYDELGDLAAVDLTDGTTITYRYDAYGRRVARLRDGEVTHGWLYDHRHRIVAELDGAGDVVARYSYVEHDHVPTLMHRDGTDHLLVTDDLGSLRRIVDAATGEVVRSVAYDAYGRVLDDTAPGFAPFGFAGGLHDPDTGLVRFGARDLDPQTGRWLAADPLGFRGGQTNLYAYVDGDPVNRLDATGQFFRGPSDVGRELGRKRCEQDCGRQYDLCEQLSPHVPGMGFDYDECADTCKEAIDDAIDDIDDVFSLADAPMKAYNTAKWAGDALRFWRRR